MPVPRYERSVDVNLLPDGHFNVNTPEIAFKGGMGDAMRNAGNAMRSFGRDMGQMAADISITQVKDAVNAATADAVKLQGDIASLNGLDATAAQRKADEGLSKIASDRFGTLGAKQQELANRFFSDRATAIRGFADSHARRQVGAAQDQADAAIIENTIKFPTPDANADIATIRATVEHNAARNGLAPEAKDALLKAKTSAYYGASIERLLKTNDYAGAKAIFDAHADELDANAKAAYEKPLLALSRAQGDQDMADGLLKRGLDVSAQEGAMAEIAQLPVERRRDVEAMYKAGLNDALRIQHLKRTAESNNAWENIYRAQFAGDAKTAMALLSAAERSGSIDPKAALAEKSRLTQTVKARDWEAEDKLLDALHVYEVSGKGSSDEKAFLSAMGAARAAGVGDSEAGDVFKKFQELKRAPAAPADVKNLKANAHEYINGVFAKSPSTFDLDPAGLWNKDSSAEARFKNKVSLLNSFDAWLVKHPDATMDDALGYVKGQTAHITAGKAAADFDASFKTAKSLRGDAANALGGWIPTKTYQGRQYRYKGTGSMNSPESWEIVK